MKKKVLVFDKSNPSFSYLLIASEWTREADAGWFNLYALTGAEFYWITDLQAIIQQPGWSINSKN